MALLSSQCLKALLSYRVASFMALIVSRLQRRNFFSAAQAPLTLYPVSPLKFVYPTSQYRSNQIFD
jgi:hypothetical protein